MGAALVNVLSIARWLSQSGAQQVLRLDPRPPDQGRRVRRPQRLQGRRSVWEGLDRYSRPTPPRRQRHEVAEGVATPEVARWWTREPDWIGQCSGGVI